MRISDWSSDVCSSDLPLECGDRLVIQAGCRQQGVAVAAHCRRAGRSGAAVLLESEAYSARSQFSLALAEAVVRQIHAARGIYLVQKFFELSHLSGGHAGQIGRAHV